MSQFNELLNELETLAKAQPADGDQKIAAAADGGAGEPGEEDETGDGGADDAGEADGKGEPMGKSFRVTMPDGSEQEAVDGTELVKSLQDRLEVTEGVILKSMNAAVLLIKSQGETIEKLNAQVTKLSGEGRGRKTAVTVTEKPSTLAKSEGAPEGLTGEQFLAKALDAQKAGRITGLDVSTAEAFINKGQQPPAVIVSRVLG